MIRVRERAGSFSTDRFTSNRGLHRRIACSIFRFAQGAMRDVSDLQVVWDFQADSMKPIIHLTGLKPDRPSDFVHPAPSGLIGRLVNVAAATEERLVLSDELRHRR